MKNIIFLCEQGSASRRHSDATQHCKSAGGIHHANDEKLGKRQSCCHHV